MVLFYANDVLFDVSESQMEELYFMHFKYYKELNKHKLDDECVEHLSTKEIIKLLDMVMKNDS